MANEEKELSKFVNDPRYREKVIRRIHNEKDNEYNREIQRIEIERNSLSRSRINEIKRISDARWEVLFNGKLLVNRIEGKIRINNKEALFSSIQGAEVNMLLGYRTETSYNSKAKSKSKKHASLGGAVIGGLATGSVIGAAVAGVAMGKTTTKTKTTGSAVSTQIPTCTHLGVFVNIDGFVSEVNFISSEIEQSSMAFREAQSDAQSFVAQIGILSKIPVPTSFIKPDEEPSVKSIEEKIAGKQKQLQEAMAKKRVYPLPDMYRMKEHKEMSDDEYLKYLADTDKIRKEEEQQYNTEQGMGENTGKGTLKTIRIILGNVVCWILSAFFLLMSFAAFITKGGIISGILFLITTICANPLAEKFIRKKLIAAPIWCIAILIIVVFYIGCLMYPVE